MECKTPKRIGVGLFSSNLLGLRKPLPPCYAVWCRECYRPHLEDTFRVQTSLSARDDKSEDLETEGRLNKRFRISREGDHLMGIPFECYLCQFRNINERYPIHGNARDNYNLLCIRRAILDAFQSRETSTVLGNFRRLRKYYFDSVEALSTKRPVRIIGTNEVMDIVGMGCALQTLYYLRRKWN